MDDEGRPTKLWARLLFQPRQHSQREYRLGMAVVGIALLLTWLIFWTFIPGLIADIALGIVNGIAWLVGLFSGSGATEVVSPTAVPDTGTLSGPSPSPSPSPSPFPR